jgi:hypothetical protein
MNTSRAQSTSVVHSMRNSMHKRILVSDPELLKTEHKMCVKIIQGLYYFSVVFIISV